MDNSDRDHAHGKCHPMKALSDQRVEAVVVGGIGTRALDRLNSMGVKVYHCVEGTAEENLQAFRDGNLAEFVAEDACVHHDHGHGGYCD